jgi:hypothetical protein
MESKLFAWWPVTVTSGKWVWLSSYYQYQALYDDTTGRPPLTQLYFIYTETAKEKFWRKLKEN